MLPKIQFYQIFVIANIVYCFFHMIWMDGLWFFLFFGFAKQRETNKQLLLITIFKKKVLKKYYSLTFIWYSPRFRSRPQLVSSLGVDNKCPFLPSTYKEVHSLSLEKQNEAERHTHTHRHTQSDEAMITHALFLSWKGSTNQQRMSFVWFKAMGSKQWMLECVWSVTSPVTKAKVQTSPTFSLVSVGAPTPWMKRVRRGVCCCLYVINNTSLSEKNNSADSTCFWVRGRRHWSFPTPWLCVRTWIDW